MDWKIEKSDNNYHVVAYDEDGLVSLDRDVEDFASACILVDELKDQTRNQVKEKVGDYDTAFWLHATK